VEYRTKPIPDAVPAVNPGTSLALQAAHGEAIEKLWADLNATQTIFPATRLRLIFQNRVILGFIEIRGI